MGARNNVKRIIIAIIIAIVLILMTVVMLAKFGIITIKGYERIDITGNSKDNANNEIQVNINGKVLTANELKAKTNSLLLKALQIKFDVFADATSFFNNYIQNGEKYAKYSYTKNQISKYLSGSALDYILETGRYCDIENGEIHPYELGASGRIIKSIDLITIKKHEKNEYTIDVKYTFVNVDEGAETISLKIKETKGDYRVSEFII